MDFPTIPIELARRAHLGTSFVPDERAKQEVDGFARTLQSDYDGLRAGIEADMVPSLDEEFTRHTEGYRRKTLEHLAAKSRCVSSMIAGPANFPVARMEKINNAEHNKLTALLEFRERALSAIAKKLHPESRPIMSGDDDAVERLEAKIAEAETEQQRMKAANAAIRKNAKRGREAQIAALREIGIGEQHASELLKPDYVGRIGFSSFELTNNNANIRRMKERLEGLRRNKVAVVETREFENGIKLESNPADNRVRIYFPGKPDACMRDRLKRSGFRWSPTAGCWQAYRNNRAVEAALAIAKQEA